MMMKGFAENTPENTRDMFLNGHLDPKIYLQYCGLCAGQKRGSLAWQSTIAIKYLWCIRGIV